MHITPVAQSRPNAALRRLIWAGAIVLLALPALAMQFTREVNWGAQDFVIGGVLLLGAALLLDRVLGSQWSRRSIIPAGGAVLFMLVFVWAELAVGLVGSPWAGN